MYFPDYPYPVNICGFCATHADEYGYLNKDEDTTPVGAYEGKNVLVNLNDRSALSSLGVLIVRDVLEVAGPHRVDVGLLEVGDAAAHDLLTNQRLARFLGMDGCERQGRSCH